MCAGNSKEEALCQGLNEIVERYILWKIFSENPQPNQLSIEMFTSTEIYNKINTLKNLYEIRIHDWSLGEDYPVIGLLIIRKTDGAYTYRLGAAFNIITALERCYTETLQGENGIEKNIPFQISTALRPAGGTETARIQLENGGIPVCHISIPNRYMHSCVEMCNINDAYSTVNLLENALSMLSEADIDDFNLFTI